MSSRLPKLPSLSPGRNNFIPSAHPIRSKNSRYILKERHHKYFINKRNLGSFNKTPTLRNLIGYNSSPRITPDLVRTPTVVNEMSIKRTKVEPLTSSNAGHKCEATSQSSRKILLNIPNVKWEI